DHLAPEALLATVNDPGGVDFADVEIEPQLVGMLLEVLHVGEAGVVLTAQQSLADDRLGDDVDYLLPLGEVDVALGRRHDPDRTRRLDLAAAEQDQVLGWVDEGVDDEDLLPVLLGDLVHLGMSAALDEEAVRPLPQHLQAYEELGDQLDPIFVDTLELEVAPHGPLVTCSLRSERDHRDLVP